MRGIIQYLIEHAHTNTHIHTGEGWVPECLMWSKDRQWMCVGILHEEPQTLCTCSYDFIDTFTKSFKYLLLPNIHSQ